MMLDLLRLLSIGQNMELYASLQIRQQPQQANQSQAQANEHNHSQAHGLDPNFAFSQRQANHNHNHNHHHQCNTPTGQDKKAQDDWQLPRSTARAQSAAAAAAAVASEIFRAKRHSDQPKNEVPTSDAPLDLTVKPAGRKRHGAHKRSRPPPLNLKLCVPKDQRRNNGASKHQHQHTYRLQRHKLIKLISSSTSPSSTTTSPSIGSPLDDNYQLANDHNNNNNNNSGSCSTSSTSNRDPNDRELELTADLISSSQQTASATDATNLTSSNSNATSINLLSNHNTPSSSAPTKRQKLKGLKSHLCLQCGVSFSRSDMLTRHSRLHTGVKPYRCAKCKQEFSRSDHLSTHERTHTGEKPYQCQYCAYSACRRDMITRHMRTHQQPAQSSGLSDIRLKARRIRNSNAVRSRLFPVSLTPDPLVSCERDDNEVKLDLTW